MSNRKHNIDAIIKVASALGQLNDEVVFVGGAVVGFYADDPAADDVRPTEDVDILIQIASPSELEELREELIKKGFRQTADDNITCRFRLKDIKVDVLSTKEIGWAPANPWFETGILEFENRQLENVTIKILKLPFFLAAKFVAFNHRGQKDARISTDFEDITYILDNRSDLVEVFMSSTEDVKEFIKLEISKIKESRTLQEAILGNLEIHSQNDRYNLIMHRLNEISSS
ncbi:nucleotidyl transferase AbiEii/AbiGii toxin family protein [Bacteroidota bacterium]